LNDTELKGRIIKVHSHPPSASTGELSLARYVTEGHLCRLNALARNRGMPPFAPCVSSQSAPQTASLRWLPSGQTYRGWAGAKAEVDVAGGAAGEDSAEASARARGGIVRTTGRAMAGAVTAPTEAVEAGIAGQLTCTPLCTCADHVLARVRLVVCTLIATGGRVADRRESARPGRGWSGRREQAARGRAHPARGSAFALGAPSCIVLGPPCVRLPAASGRLHAPSRRTPLRSLAPLIPRLRVFACHCLLMLIVPGSQLRPATGHMNAGDGRRRSGHAWRRCAVPRKHSSAAGAGSVASCRAAS
jgi:hypothetical protein